MADLQKTIQIIFGATDNVSDVTGNIDNSIGGLASSVESSTQPFADLAGNILKVELALAAMGVAALYYANTQAVKLSGAQASLTKVLGEGEGAASDYSSEIQDLALQFGVAGDATTNTVADFKQAGFSISESLDLIDVALTGVKIAELSAEEAGNLLIRNIRGLGAEADDATHFLDAWNEVSNNYAATAKEVAIATGTLAPAANAAGLSFDQLVGLVTPMIEVLGSGAEAANALKVGLANLISDNKRVVDALTELGIAQRDVNGDLKQSGTILDELGTLWPTLSESQKANYGILLFGKEQYVRMNIVLNDYNKVLEVTEVSINSQGSALKELEVALNKASTSSERFGVAFGFAAAAVGNQFLDNTTAVNNSLTELAISFLKVVDGGGLQPLFDFLNPLLDEFAVNLSKIATNLPEAFKGVDFSGLIKSFQEIGFELGDLFGDVDLTTVEGLTQGIQKVLDTLTSLNTIFAGVVEGFAPVIEIFKELANEAGDADTETSKFIGNVIGYGATINTFAGWLGGLTSVFDALSDAVILLIGAKSLGLIPESFGAAGVAASGLSKALGKAGLLGAAYAVGDALGTMLYESVAGEDWFKDLADSVFDLIPGLSLAEEKLNLQAKAQLEAAVAAATYGSQVDETADAHVQAYEAATKYDDEVNEMAASSEDAARASGELELAQARLALEMIKNGLNADGTAFKLDKLNEVVKVASGEFAGWYKVMEDGNEVYYKTKTAAEAAIAPIKEIAEVEKKAAEEAEKAAEATRQLALEYEKLEVEMEQIASNERIKTMEFFVQLETAKVEADAKKVIAAFDSIATSYSATSSLIGTLYGELSELSRSDQIALEASIRKAEKIAQEQHDKQMELLDAQIEQIEAQTDRAKAGDSLITVDGGELQPELEAIMQSLFKSIRIKMSADYENFLFGLQP